MSPSRKSALTCSLVCWFALAANTAHAADQGAYATALFGLATQSDQALAFSGAGAPQSANARLDNGAAAGGAVGWEFGNGWRLEGEFMYQSVDSDVAGFLAPGPSGDGNFASTSVAVNALYSVDLFGSPRAQTYFGGGLVRLTEVDIDIGDDAAGKERSYSGSGSGFQLLFGARYALGKRWYLDAGLRWLRATSLDLDGEGAAAGRIKADYEPWAATVGIGWRF